MPLICNTFEISEKIDYLLCVSSVMQACGAICAFIGYLYADEIRGMLEPITTRLSQLLFVQIKSENYRVRTALKAAVVNSNRLAYNVMTYDVAEGTYNVGNMKIAIKEKSVCLWALTRHHTVEDLKNFISAQMARHCNPQHRLFYFMNSQNEWRPCVRRPASTYPEHLSGIMEYVAKFKTSEVAYATKGHPYRLGIALIGNSGTGKSTVPAYIATKYGNPVYLVNLNDGKHMTSAALINLIAVVPEHSIVVFDEADKQFENGKSVSWDGILSAIDGPHRLPHGVIVIITANSPLKCKHLVRPGRIDRVFTL